LKYDNIKLTVSILLIAALGLPWVVKNPYYLHLLTMVYVNAILGMGFALIYSTGLVTLGASAFWGIGAYASALLVMKAGLTFWLAMPLSAILAAMVALGFGFLAIRYAGLGFVVFTLLFCFVVERVFGYIPVFGGWGGIIGIPTPDPIRLPLGGSIDFSARIPYYYLSLLLLLAAVITFSSLYSSRIGRAWWAIKLDPNLAAAVGVYTYGYRLGAFVLASGFAGLVGSFYAHYSMAISPEAFGLLKSVYIQIYAILGGLEHCLLGPLLGSLVFTVLPEIFQFYPSVEPYVTGVTLIAIVIFLPSGLAGLVQIVLRAITRLRPAARGKSGVGEATL